MSYYESCHIIRRPAMAVSAFDEKTYSQGDEDVESVIDSLKNEKARARAQLPLEVVAATGYFHIKRGVSACAMLSSQDTIRGDITDDRVRLSYTVKYNERNNDVATKAHKFAVPKTLPTLVRDFENKSKAKKQFTIIDGETYQVLYHKEMQSQKCKHCSVAQLSIYDVLLRQGDDPNNATIMIKFLHMRQRTLGWLYNLLNMRYSTHGLPARVNVAQAHADKAAK
ncbi:hypothetical protein PVAG01_10109 [Phlyctema vagabunda]|uniref:Uncharacterized protein n=1 Tax=Phlyctema vagabunda TaxID=108571 RepID=A0ABR4P507_9HELO